MSADESDIESVYIRLRGRIQGPFDTEQLRLMHQRGQFGRAHEVSDDRVNWRSAATMTTVFVAPKARPLPQLKPVPKPDSGDAIVSLGEEPAEKSPRVVTMGPAKMMKPVWHYSVGKETHGPVTILELRGLLSGGQLQGSDLVWKEGLADWAPASEVAELSESAGGRSVSSIPGSSGMSNYCSACGNAMDARAELCPKCGVRQRPAIAPKSRMITAMLAIFLGSFGLHRFYLGQALLGLAYTITWFLFMVAFVGFLVNGAGLAALLSLLATGLPTVVSFIEGVVFLCTSDADFARRYNPR